ncbi:hypothetical protein LX32DRAFT_61288 [Colletotrichum zoysiae]|uniref:Uncharacterized protein n=1 Tax=Colletotrichum zoysiae TaxID=1216348 RepID=A0AAD9HAN8_9PEZI|nr:hypothetical protein LX32DRAFT_61288 [Colletotrichum zoysiae]
MTGGGVQTEFTSGKAGNATGGAGGKTARSDRQTACKAGKKETRIKTRRTGWLCTTTAVYLPTTTTTPLPTFCLFPFSLLVSCFAMLRLDGGEIRGGSINVDELGGGGLKFHALFLFARHHQHHTNITPHTHACAKGGGREVSLDEGCLGSLFPWCWIPTGTCQWCQCSSADAGVSWAWPGPRTSCC